MPYIFCGILFFVEEFNLTLEETRLLKELLPSLVYFIHTKKSGGSINKYEVDTEAALPLLYKFMNSSNYVTSELTLTPNQGLTSEVL